MITKVDQVRRFNVKDEYINFANAELIKQDLNSKRFSFGICCENLEFQTNMGAAVRLSNAFAAKEIILYRNKKYNRRGTTGCHHYENIRHVKYETDLDLVLNGYHNVVAIDNVPGSVCIDEVNFDELVTSPTVYCFGSEAEGLSYDILGRADKVVYIRTFGSVRSINVCCALSIVLHEHTKAELKLRNV